MIDIFYSDNPPYMENLGFRTLLFGSMGEIGQFAITVFIITGLFLLSRHIRQRKLYIAVLFLMPFLQLLNVWLVSIRSEFFFSVMFALLLTLATRMMELLPITGAGYLFFFSVLLFPARLFNYTSALWGHLWLFWIIFCTCYLTVKLDRKQLHGNHFAAYVLFLTLSLTGYLVYLSMSFLMPYMEQLLKSRGMGMVSTMSLSMAAILLILFIVRSKFRQKLLRLNRLGFRYPKIEVYFPRFSVLILVICTLIFLPFTVMSSQNPLVLLLFPCLCITLLILQLPFLFLLFQAAFYKDTAALSETEKEGLSTYYQDLNANLETLQSIRHDMKNIFFTMGGFVDRSDDAEMKEFYWKKIFPYSQNSIHQSELLSAAYQLPNETLRAFFYLKLSQALQRQVQVSISIHILPEQFQLGMDLIDLTRVLGILLDNAIEEAEQMDEGIVNVQISGNETACSYIIKNSITNRTKCCGIHPGKTTKGAGHGQGLLIVRQILEQYHNATLNSCMHGNQYIQSLNINYG